MTPESQRASHQEILTVAARLFSRHGFDGVSLSAIANAAGTSKANVLYHFTSKDQLYIKVIEASCVEVMGALALALDSAASIGDRLQDVASRHLEHLLEKPDLNRLILRELQHGDGERVHELVHGVLREHFNGIVDHVRSAQASGGIRSDIDPAVLVMSLLGSNLFFFAHREHLRVNENCEPFVDNPEFFSRELINILLGGAIPPGNLPTKE